jgi:DNA polymerase
MGWGDAIRRKAQVIINRPDITPGIVDWNRLVTIDFESYWDSDYTLSKLSTSEYVRDKRFKAQMVGIKIGNKPTKVYTGQLRIMAALQSINWATHSLLCHNTAFDGFILSHVYKIVPFQYYDTLSMARGLHSNEIGASLDEVAQFYGKGSKLDGVLETTKGVGDWDQKLVKAVTPYCAQDVDLTHAIFKEMHAKFPADELDLVDMTIRMFCDPVLKVDIPRVQKEYEREVAERKRKFYAVLDPKPYYADKTVLKTTAERALTGEERDMLIIKRVIGSNEKFADLLRAEGIDPPMKPSKAYIKLSKEEKALVAEEDKWSYAFAKDDAEFTSLPENIDLWRGALDPNKVKDIPKISAKQDRIRSLVDARLAVKSTTNITRAERFLKAGANGMSLPVGYAYYRAHTGRWGGNNKMNMQNLTRGGELRLSILAPKGYQMCVVDSGQIEARVNGWLWGQDDLMAAFRAADAGTGSDAYCNFATLIYGRPITKEDKTERFVGKVCLGPDTIVLTNHGLKSIPQIRSNDLLWDGKSWVTHDGLVKQGVRTTLSYRGISATPDHEILTERGWLEWQEVLTDRSLFRSALSSANLPSYGGSITRQKTASRGGIALSASALAGPSLWSMSAALRQDALRDATLAQKLRQAQNATGSTGMLCRMTSIALACLTACHQQLRAVVTRTMPRISTMGDAASQFILAGATTEQSFCGMSRHYLDGMYLSLSLIESTTTAGTAQATSDSPLSLSTPETSDESKTSNNAFVISKQTTQTYDLANAGPNHCFTVMSDDGPVIVHNCVLGLGFQMGAPKFQMTLAKGALGGPPIFFELDRCVQIVNTYRRTNHKIKGGWDICAKIIEDMAAGRSGRHGPITWEKETIWLPNGMSLKYPELRKAVSDKGWDEWSYKSGDMRKKIYGGLLCENIVQALARIIVAWQMLQIRKKYRIVMTTHDEAVALPKTAQAKQCFALMTKVMSTAPSWCPDIPLACEGGHASNYSK